MTAGATIMALARPQTMTPREAVIIEAAANNAERCEPEQATSLLAHQKKPAKTKDLESRDQQEILEPAGANERTMWAGKRPSRDGETRYKLLKPRISFWIASGLRKVCPKMDCAIPNPPPQE